MRVNLFDYSKTVEGYIDPRDGNVVLETTELGDRVSELIRVKTGENYTFNLNWDNSIVFFVYCNIGLYDNDKNFVSMHEIFYGGGGDENSYTTDWTCPSNVSYIRFTGIFFTGQDAFNVEILGSDVSDSEDDVKDVKDVEDVEDVGAMSNLIDYSKLVVGYIQSSNGAVNLSKYGTDRVTDFIRVIPERSYLVQFAPLFEEIGWTWIAIAYFDENFNYISEMDLVDTRSTVELNETWVCPQNVAYVRISSLNFESFASNFMLVEHKTILKLHANGDFETVDTELQQGLPFYSFSENSITVPSIVEYPPLEKRNYFIEKTSSSGYLYSENGQLGEATAEKERVSDFINVDGWGIATIRIHYYNIHPNYNPWLGVYTFNSNKQLLSIPVYSYQTATNKDYYVFEYKLAINTGFIRVCSTLYDLEGTTVKISVEKGDTINQKHYLALEDMPSWVRDTGNPISIFPEGVVIKGELIQSSEVIFMDDFNRANSNTLGDNWTIASGGYAIQNNKAIGTNLSSTHNIAFYNKTYSNNISISADITYHASEGIVFRGTDASNYLHAQFDAGKLVLKSRINNTVTTAQTVLFGAITTGTTYRVRVELRDSQIKIFVDDVLHITHESSQFIENGRIGFQSWSNSPNIGRFDNFEIKRLT